MNTFLSYVRLLAPIAAAVTTALTPFEGKHEWFVALVAGMSAITLLAPTVLPAKANVTVNSSQEPHQ